MHNGAEQHTDRTSLVRCLSGLCVCERQSVLHSDQFNCSLTEAVRHSEDMNHTWGDVYHPDVWHQLYFNTQKKLGIGSSSQFNKEETENKIFSVQIRKTLTLLFWILKKLWAAVQFEPSAVPQLTGDATKPSWWLLRWLVSAIFDNTEEIRLNVGSRQEPVILRRLSSFPPTSVPFLPRWDYSSVAQITDEMTDSSTLKRTTLTTIPQTRSYKHRFTLLVFLFPRLESKHGPCLISADTEQFYTGEWWKDATSW